MTGGAIPCHDVLRAGHWSGATDATVSLGYADRFLRRKRIEARNGLAILVDLPQVTSLDHGDALALADGRRVLVQAAAEDLYAVTGPDLARLAWHVGNRHAPAQIDGGRLLIARDPVLRDMLGRLGADVTEVREPFTPEGGAYGHGRTHGHSHGAEHDHLHGPA